MFMRYLSLKDLLLLHEQIIDASGGSAGVRDYGRLESAVAAQEQEVFGRAVYGTLFQKAAAIARGIIADHPFIDSNKRTGIMAALLFLEANGSDTSLITDLELEDFAVKIAVEHLAVPEIAAWLEAHATVG